MRQNICPIRIETGRLTIMTLILKFENIKARRTNLLTI